MDVSRVLIAILLCFSSWASAQETKSEKIPETKVDESSAQLIRFPVEKYQLANGLTVLLHEDHSVPLISYHTWFRVGSKDEEPGLTGMAHLFEHMMFKGTKKYSGDQFDQILQANGANNNAFTTQDYTGYYENLPPTALELVMDIESDRMVNLTIDQKNLDSERDVVKEERRMRVDNNPVGSVYERIYETVFKISPYKWPVIGYMKDLDNVTVENATKFYRTYYAPNNAVLVIAGDFKTSRAKELIEKFYSKIPRQEIPEKKPVPEPDQKAFRTAFIARDVQSPTVTLSYQAPKAGNDEAYALDLLSNIMGYGPSSRLYRRLVHTAQSATGVSVYNTTHQAQGVVTIMAELKPGQDPKNVEELIRRELWGPQNRLVTPRELKSAKNQIIMQYVDSLKTVFGKARSLAYSEIIYNNYEQLFNDLEKYMKVTPEEIKKSASKYLGKEKSVLVTLTPKAAKKQEKVQ